MFNKLAISATVTMLFALPVHASVTTIDFEDVTNALQESPFEVDGVRFLSDAGVFEVSEVTPSSTTVLTISTLLGGSLLSDFTVDFGGAVSDLSFDILGDNDAESATLSLFSVEGIFLSSFLLPVDGNDQTRDHITISETIGSFTISNITDFLGFSYDNFTFSRFNGGVSEVPLPGAFWLMLVGLSGIRFAKHKQRF